MTEMYRKWGITQPDSMTFPDLSEFTTVYFDHLAKGLENWTEGYSCPGAREILEALAREPGVQLGLETGNFREAAFIKLRKFGMDVFFEEGGFGGDWTTRMEVVADAIAKCQALESTIYERGNIFVIGDSISDVKAGQANGINSVAVATGHYNMGKLASLNPTYIFPDLSDTAKVLEALLG